MVNQQLPKTFHIFYAWAEGPWHGKVLSTALKKAGFTEVSASSATILIAHSVGSFLARPSEHNKIIILIGPPYWPGKPISLRLFLKVRQDFRKHRTSLSFWLRKMGWTTIYISIKPVVSLRAWRVVHATNPLSAMSPEAIIVRNEDDPFCTPALANSVKNRIVVLPGQHDDCWSNPDPYIKLIETEYATRTKD